MEAIHKLSDTIVLCTGVSSATCDVATNTHSQYALYVTAQHNILSLAFIAMLPLE